MVKLPLLVPPLLPDNPLFAMLAQPLTVQPPAPPPPPPYTVYVIVAVIDEEYAALLVTVKLHRTDEVLNVAVSVSEPAGIENVHGFVVPEHDAPVPLVQLLNA